MTTSMPVVLPSGVRIRLIAAPVLLTTKFEAFASRGRGQIICSHNFEDIINVLDGRPSIENEVCGSVPELIDYLAKCFHEVASHRDFENTLPGLIAFDALHTERLESVRQRIAAIAALK